MIPTWKPPVIRRETTQGHTRAVRRLPHLSEGPFSLAAETPLPDETRNAALFPRGTPPGEITAFWGAQVARLEKLAIERAMDQAQRDRRILPEIAPSEGRFAAVALSQLFRHYGLRGQKWLWQFANGFPITGSLSQADLVPPSKRRNFAPTGGAL